MIPWCLPISPLALFLFSFHPSNTHSTHSTVDMCACLCMSVHKIMQLHHTYHQFSLHPFLLQVILCWNTMGWSSPPKTGITTTQRTTAPPSITAPGGTVTATPPTLMASTCVGSTLPMLMASSGPPGLAGSTPSSSLRWRYDPPATPRANEKVKSYRREKKKKEEESIQTFLKHEKPQILTAIGCSYLSSYCLLTETYLFEFNWLCCSLLIPGCLSSVMLLLHHLALLGYQCHAGSHYPSLGPFLILCHLLERT